MFVILIINNMRRGTFRPNLSKQDGRKQTPTLKHWSIRGCVRSFGWREISVRRALSQSELWTRLPAKGVRHRKAWK